MSILSSHPNVHIIGIGGAGMSGVALLLKEMGCKVSGSDATDSPVLGELKSAGITVHVGHDASLLDTSSVVIWSPAVKEDNVEFAAAKQHGNVMLSRIELLRELSAMTQVVGLTGTHGKTTATSMMACVLKAAGRDDGRLLGAPVHGVGANGHWGSPALLIEVDESYGTFSELTPYCLGLLNVEPDHLDHYGSLENLEEAFAQLLQRTSGPVVVWNTDPGSKRVGLRCNREVVSVGTDSESTYQVSDIELERRSSHFRLKGAGLDVTIALNVTGAHNVANASVVCVLALELGISLTEISNGLSNFQGAPRRFEFMGSWRGVDVYEDYAHLPGEIEATISAARAAGYEKITCVFQPHRVTRTQHLAQQFHTSFSGATNLIVTDIYTAGEANPDGATGQLISDGTMKHISTSYCATFTEVAHHLEALHDKSDVVLLLGAGDIAAVAKHLEGGLQK
jgi:UDP-N-acetylmuramate--alanine ligase